MTTIPLTMPAGGYFSMTAQVAGDPAPGVLSMKTSSWIVVSNTAGTQTFGANPAADVDIALYAYPDVVWAKNASQQKGTDLNLDATNKQIVTTAGGVFVVAYTAAFAYTPPP